MLGREDPRQLIVRGCKHLWLDFCFASCNNLPVYPRVMLGAARRSRGPVFVPSGWGQIPACHHQPPLGLRQGPASLSLRSALRSPAGESRPIPFNVPKQLPEGQKSPKFCSAFAWFVFIFSCPPETLKKQHQAVSGSEAVPLADVSSLNPARCSGTDPASPHPA